MNDFVKVNTMGEGTSFTENGAVSYASCGTALLDQFAKAGTARGRDLDNVWVEQSLLWAENPEYALKFPFYLRMITRQTTLLDGDKSETVQRGQGAKDESFKRLWWIAKYHPEDFYKNLWLLPIVGSWKDLWVLLTMDETLNKEEFFKVFAEGINSEYHKDLVKKYLPRIRSTKKCTTEWARTTNALAKEFAKFAGWSYKDYREFKATGKAHEFQTIICKGLYKNINWKAIPGKALLNLVSGKFLSNHNLEKSYTEWIKSQPVAKFNGYPYELGLKAGYYTCDKLSLAQKITIDKQFDGLIQTASQDGGAIKGNVLCALDTSGSMTSEIEGGPNGLTSYDVCVSLGIYFSELNTGAFHNVVAMFDYPSRLKELKGSFTDKLIQIRKSNTAWGGTNFLSLIRLICDTRRNHPEIPESEFPQTLLVISDMQFNNCGKMTNYETAKEKLRKYFSEEFVENFKFVWWYCAGRDTKDFPSNMECGGSYVFSGFDGAVVSLLLGGEPTVDKETGKKVQPTMEEMVQKALSQEVLCLVQNC